MKNGHICMYQIVIPFYYVFVSIKVNNYDAKENTAHFLQLCAEECNAN